MSDFIEDNKYVELNYKTIDKKTGKELTGVEYPIGYVHGVNDILSKEIMDALRGCTAGEVIEVPIDSKKIFGERDEALVFTDLKENVPEDYHEVGTRILMENDKGDVKEFYVTRVDDKTVTIDGNNPMCGREVVFRLEVLTVRDATEEEIEIGGPVEETVPQDIPDALLRKV